MLFKCKVCGGDLDVQARTSIGTCQYCGTAQTLPRIDDDKRANLYERANHFRRQGEFDKASAVYDTILNEDRTDPEAYWSLVLCKYGIEYVEDPSTRKRVPTCNRAQYASVLADEDYKQALAHADSAQKSLYEQEARVIDGIQKGILEISAKEEPFDIFICYKETDDSGKRTPDSVLAQDLYHQLTAEGFKVFFARITLEDKIGSAYEPYIFAALQSSKIMLALGTKAEYFGAAWVKNEWSRYLSLIKGGAKKTLIPAYRDMDPYSLPDEFSHLQAQDMGKLGFMQDLIRGIKKILSPAQAQAPASAPAAAPAGGMPSVASLMQRAFIELEDGNWQKADDLLEQVLNVEPQNAKAYVGKLMAELGVNDEKNLPYLSSSLEESGNFQKAIRFADDKYRGKLQGFAKSVERNIEYNRNKEIFDAAVAAADKLKTASKTVPAMAAAGDECKRVAATFRSLAGLSDASERAKELEERAESWYRMSRDFAAEEKKRVRREKRNKLIKRFVAFGIAAGIIAYFGYVRPQMALAEERKAAAIEQQAAAEQAEADKKAAAEKKAADKKAAANRAEEAKKLAAKKEAESKALAEQYAAAEALWASGDYAAGKDALNAAGGYKFGKYRWRIIDLQADKMLIITENIIERRPFNVKDASVAWETSTLRKYLNGDFLGAFSGAEKERILTTKVTNLEYGPYGGKTTKDKVFLLSKEEANRYFKDFPEDKVKKFKTMEEADAWYKKYGDRVAIYDDGTRGSWFLRDPGRAFKDNDVNYDHVLEVDGYQGDIGKVTFDSFVHIEGGVRPAMWIKLK